MPKITELSQRMINFCNYIKEGKTQLEAATLAGYKGSEGTLRTRASLLMKNPLIKENLKRYNTDMRKVFAEEAKNACQVIISLMNDAKVNSNVRLKAAQDLLDRAGYKATDKVELSGPDGNPIEFETRQTKEIVNRARKLLIDVSTDRPKYIAEDINDTTNSQLLGENEENHEDALENDLVEST